MEQIRVFLLLDVYQVQQDLYSSSQTWRFPVGVYSRLFFALTPGIGKKSPVRSYELLLILHLPSSETLVCLLLLLRVQTRMRLLWLQVVAHFWLPDLAELLWEVGRMFFMFQVLNFQESSW